MASGQIGSGQIWALAMPIGSWKVTANAASPASLPRGYWEQLLDCKTGFSPPPDILAKNSHHVAESIRRTPGLVLENGNLEFKELYQRLQMQGLTQSQIAKKIEVSQSMVKDGVVVSARPQNKA